jgi:hypothetical protein
LNDPLSGLRLPKNWTRNPHKNVRYCSDSGVDPE